MTASSPSKLRFKYTFDLAPLSLELPYPVVSKLKPDSQFYLIWKHEQDTPLRSEIATVDKSQVELTDSDDDNDHIDTPKAIQWSDNTRVLTLQTVLTKDQQQQQHDLMITNEGEKYLTKESRLLLKQVKLDKDSTIGYVRLDLSQFCNDSQSIHKLTFTKCNIQDIFLNVCISARNDSLDSTLNQNVLFYSDDNDNNDHHHHHHHQKFKNSKEKLVFHHHTRNRSLFDEINEITFQEKMNDHELINQMTTIDNDNDNDNDSDSDSGSNSDTDSYLRLQQKNKKYKQRINHLSKEIAKLKAEKRTDKCKISNIEEQLQRNTIKYNKLLSFCDSNSNSKLKSKLNQSSLLFLNNNNNKIIADLLRQNEDLEQTLIMVRNSWNQTANVMQSQVDLLKSQLESQTTEFAKINNQYKQLSEEYTELEEQYNGVQIEKLNTEKKLNKTQVTLEQQKIEHTRLLSKYTDASQKIRQMRGVISKMLRGFTNKKNEHICLVQDCCGEDDHKNRMNIRGNRNRNENGNGNVVGDEGGIVNEWNLAVATDQASNKEATDDDDDDGDDVKGEKSDNVGDSDNGTVIELESDRSE